MERSHGLLLDEQRCGQLGDQHRAQFTFEWLTRLKKLLPAADRADIQQNQHRLLQQLSNVLTGSPGPPTRWLLAHCLAMVYHLGDPLPSSLLVERCNDIIRSKDDSPSSLPTRLAAVACLGSLFEQLGRFLLGSFRDVVSNLLRNMKSAESQGRYETMLSLEKVLRGLGATAVPCHRDIYKVARTCLTDRSLAVRCAAAKCLLELQREAVFLWTSELENISTLCFRAFEGSNHNVRVAVAELLGTLLAAAVQPLQPAAGSRLSGRSQSSLKAAMDLLSGGFLRGGAGFLRASGDMLKGTSSVGKEVRVGVAQTYVALVCSLGGSWLEGNFLAFLDLLLELPSSSRATQTAADAALTRRCVCFILRSSLTALPGEKAQVSAATQLALTAAAQQRVFESALTGGNVEARGSCLDAAASPHALVCCLQELGALLLRLGATASSLLTDGSTALLDTLLSFLLHPTASVSLAAAWSLRCVAVAMPSQGSPLLEHCCQRLLALKSAPEAVLGYGAAVAALVSAVQHCPLGIPHSKSSLVLALAEDLLRSASQNSRISLQRTRAGWLLICSFITSGAAVVKLHLPRLLLLWRCVFPASLREQEMELQRGDYFTWQVTLEGRAGALCAMRKLQLHCPQLVTDDAISRLFTPLACAVTLLAKLPALLSSHGASLQSVWLLYRLRVYELLALLPPPTYRESFGLLMNQLVLDVSAQDNLNQVCSELTLLLPLCHRDDLLLVGPAPCATDHIDEQLHGCGGVGGASLDNDAFSLCDSSSEVPAPAAPPVSLTAAAVQLFGVVFPHVICAQRVKILEQFVETVNKVKGQRHQTAQTHVCAALCSLLKLQGQVGGSLGPEELRAPAAALLLAALENGSPLLRCVAAEGLARLVQVVADPGFTISASLLCFDRLKTARDAASRSGYALALGALQRYTGGISSTQHLNTCLGVLFTLSQDHTSPEVQTWALHSLALIIDLSGALFRARAESTFALVLGLLLSAPPTHPEVHHSLGRCLHALITCLGPDLQGSGDGVSALRSSALVGCEVMQSIPDRLVQSRSISCLQQLHLFCPSQLDLSSLVPALCANLCSSFLSLRRAVVACLQQLVQREAQEVSQQAVALVKERPRRDTSQLEVTLKEAGLEGALFALLDQEAEPGLRRSIQEILIHMMASSSTSGKLGHWLKLCKDVLSASTDCRVSVEVRQEYAEADGGRDDDWSALEARPEPAGPFRALRWSTRCFAMECVCGIMAQCEGGDPAHFSMALAQERRLHGSAADFLVLHLGDLVRMAFMSATDHSDHLQLAGLQTLLVIIRCFSSVPEPEFPGHVILEQFQANGGGEKVGAALRPAFNADAPPDVTVKACQVCSAWITSGVVSDFRDLRRVYQLLTTSLAKVQAEKSTWSQLFNEATATMEALAVLKAWAEVYIAAVERSRSEDNSHLLRLVQSDLPTLSRLWLAVLQDHALLTLGQEEASPLAGTGGSFYTAETVNQARAHYGSAWAPILHATSLWLHGNGFVASDDAPANLSRPATPTSMGRTSSVGGAKSPEDINADRLHLILGISVEFLCSPHSEDQMENICSCLRALQALLDVAWPRARMGMDQVLSVELLSVLHRLMVTREAACIQRSVLELLQQVVSAAQEHIREKRHSAEVDDGAAEKETLPEFGEGRETGGLVPGRSLVFGALELCFCVLVRKLPQLSPKLAGGPRGRGAPVRSLSQEDCQLVSLALCILSELPSICSPQGSVSILPTVLHLVLGVLRELVHRPANTKVQSPPDCLVQAVLQALKVLVTCPLSRQEKSRGAWRLLLRSALSTLLGLWEPGEHAVDQASLLTALTVFLQSAGVDVCGAEPLHTLCLQRFLAAMDAKEPQVVTGCFQLMTSVFQAPPAVAVPYIRALGPPLLRFLQKVERSRPQSPEDLRGVLEGLRALEALVQAAEESHRPQLVAILLQLLISFLLDENALGSAPTASRLLHEAALKDLMRLGPAHSCVFRSLVASSPHSKSRLEAAIRGNQEALNTKPGSDKATTRKSAMSPPSIMLKTNFL
uniref:HEAT repeat-containing protein 5A n=1 Tax=Tetraodon nigroviridis TaxID=99883 RepID=H3CA84_TETNG